MTTISDLSVLKGIIDDFTLDEYRSLVDRYMRLLIGNIESLGAPVWGPKERRIGCFGPYTGRSWPIINEVMKKISDKGFTAITMRGFYLPNAPNDFHEFDSLLTDEIIEARDRVYLFLYLLYFPRIVARGTFFLNEFRSQLRELRGAFDVGMPRFGYTVHRKILKLNPCIYLVSGREGRAIPYTECSVKNRRLCEREWGTVFCPFYHSLNVPVETRELFFGDKGRLYAIRRGKFDVMDLLLDILISIPL